MVIFNRQFIWSVMLVNVVPFLNVCFRQRKRSHFKLINNKFPTMKPTNTIDHIVARVVVWWRCKTFTKSRRHSFTCKFANAKYQGCSFALCTTKKMLRKISHLFIDRTLSIVNEFRFRGGWRVYIFGSKVVAKSAFNEGLLLWITLKTIHQQFHPTTNKRCEQVIYVYFWYDDGWARISCFIDFGLATIGIQPKIDTQMPNVDWMGCAIKGVKNDGTNKQ